MSTDLSSSQSAQPTAPRPAQRAQPSSGARRQPTQDGGGEHDDVPEDEDAMGSAMGELLPSGLTSMIVHIVILLAAALWIIDPPQKEKEPDLVATAHETIEEEEEEIFDEDISLDEVDEVVEEVVEQAVPIEDVVTDDTNVVSEFNEAEASESVPDLDIPQMNDFGPLSNLTATEVTTHKGGHAISGRGRMQRAALARTEGGSAQSEEAVEQGLAWIARNQLPDGGWDFRPSASLPKGSCDGDNKARTAATAMAVLPYLGAGYTHKEGKYKRQVLGGLKYLLNSMKPHQKSGGGSLDSGGRNYDHGLALIALAEAYAMTGDSYLHGPVVAATKYSLYSQDPNTGGWMYTPRAGGDTSVTGWHVMGLKSAAMAKIPVPKAAFALTNRWLQSVSFNSGSSYGYRKPGDRPASGATTAAGHLCLMYMGRGKDDPGLLRGVNMLSAKGPDLGDLYYTYYASQILHHVGGTKWKKWNEQTRDPLVSKQAKAGITKGSWKLVGHDHGFKQGGRLYTTALATMILEVYYRHLPLYKEKGIDAGELAGWDLEE